MDLKLQGKKVVVTGGSKGIGEAIVHTLIQEGAEVFFCARQSENVNQILNTYREISHQIHGTALDVTNKEAFAAWLQEIGHFDVFIPNVSALSGSWDDSLEIDLKSTIHCIEAVIPWLSQSQAPAITYIGSKASSFATPGFESYGAVKAAMTHYMKSLATGLVSKKIRVNVVSPGDTFVENGFWDNIRQHHPEVYDATIAANPMGRLCTPQEVASAVAFISSPQASFINGTNLIVDGCATNHIHI